MIEFISRTDILLSQKGNYFMIDNAILVLNAGSSSLKFALFRVPDVDNTDAPLTLQRWLSGQVQGLYTAPHVQVRKATGDLLHAHRWSHELGHAGALAYLMEFLRQQAGAYRLQAVGHRVVHGGTDYVAPVRVEAAVLERLEQLIPLAPLHQPHNLNSIRVLLQHPDSPPQVACFDTAFHHTQPRVAQTFALPFHLTEQGIRRYGFHGLSYQYIAEQLPMYDRTAALGRTIVLHLGNGASLCALEAGRSVASTMGFTAVEGLPMGTRCGTLDPGVILYLLNARGMDARAIEKLLYEQSGLLGVSGISSDMRTLEASADPRAQFAIELFVYRISRELGSLAAALGGLDALVFTAGIGEHSVLIRERVCQSASWLGIELDRSANQRHGPRISTPTSRVAVWVIPTDEEWMIARQTWQVVTACSGNHESSL